MSKRFEYTFEALKDQKIVRLVEYHSESIHGYNLGCMESALDDASERSRKNGWTLVQVRQVKA